MFDSQVVVLGLRLLHIVSGVLWVGAVFMLAVFLIPSIRAAGPSGGPVMQQISQVRRLPLVLQWVTWLTLLSGVALYWRLSAGFSSSWWTTRPGLAFGIGGLLAIAGAVLGLAVSAPLANRMGALGAKIAAGGGPPTPEQGAEMAHMQNQLLLFARIGTVLLIAATVLMAVARYL